MYFLYSVGGVSFNKCWITLSILNCYSPNFQGFILMKNALNNQVGMLGDMILWLVANLKQGGIYFIKQGGGNHKIAWVYLLWILCGYWRIFFFFIFMGQYFLGFFLNASIQCAAVSINLKLICVPPQSVAQFISARITCHGIFPRFELQPPTILFKLVSFFL